MRHLAPLHATLAFVTLCLWTSFTSPPVDAQPRTSVGLSAVGAVALQEAGNYPHSPNSGDRFGEALAVGDFDSDGFDDVAIGIPGNDRTTWIWDAGSVDIRLGSAISPLSRLITLAPWNNAVDPSEAFDEYGTALAAGDFNGDGRDDLAVGLPGNDQLQGSQVVNMGGVQLHLGLPAPVGGLPAVADYSFSQVTGGGLPGMGSVDDEFGRALAFGDFNGDGRDELAVGIPADAIDCGSRFCRAGSVMVIGSEPSGGYSGYLMSFGLQGLPGNPASGQRFGASLATGDFDGDGFDDLAIGAPGWSDWAGSVLVVYGSPFSLIFRDHEWLGQVDFGYAEEANDEFGSALATGDFNGDGFDDLAMAAVNETFQAQGEGAVLVANGHWTRTWGPSAALLTGFTAGVGTAEPFDRFGSSLAAGDFNDDGFEDLAIGSSGEDVGDEVDSGFAAVILGSETAFAGAFTSRGLLPTGFLGSMLPPVPAGSIRNGRWGWSLAAGDFDGNGFADLAIGAPGHDASNASAAGAAGAIFGQLFLDSFEMDDTLEWSSSQP